VQTNNKHKKLAQEEEIQHQHQKNLFSPLLGVQFYCQVSAVLRHHMGYKFEERTCQKHDG